MKRFSLVLTLLLSISISTFAQQEGKIFFSETRNIQIELPEDSPISQEQFKKMIPNNQVSKRVLFFSAKESLYTAAKDAQEGDDEISTQSESGDVVIKFKMAGASSDNKVYRNFEKEEGLQKMDFMGKTFLIQDKEEKLPWKLGTETKEVLGYNCRNATTEINDRKIEAWFTTEIAVAGGPASYYGLPGMILELKSEGERGGNHIQATEIQLEKLEDGTIEEPKKGKKVSRKEYRKIVEQKTKEMQEQMGGKGNIIIRG